MRHHSSSAYPHGLREQIQKMSEAPGVYRFYNDNHHLLYIGKARNLKKRLSSYLRTQANERLKEMVKQIASVQTTLTPTENEALLLESNLIKTFKPPYNVLLRDDKQYPYLILSNHPSYPRLSSYRGKPKDKAEYFGPYVGTLAMRESLKVLQKVFKLRSCQDTFFKNRVRPCLQHQIKRCSAPCVGLISPEDYQKDVHRVRLFLRGQNAQVIQELTEQIDKASQQEAYEKAAQLLDQIQALRHIQQQQSIITRNSRSTDVINWCQKAGLHCVYVLPVRDGDIIGGEAYFPEAPFTVTKQAILSEFISQFYTDTIRGLPEQIIVETPLIDQDWIISALSKQHQRSLKICSRSNQTQLQWLAIAQQNAEHSLDRLLNTQQQQHHQRLLLQQALNLSHVPQRIECFDISHSHGEATTASCVVFDSSGPLKNEYRRFNIKGITPGDDYAAMQQALKRRYQSSDKPLPNVLVIDGGKGQLTQAVTLLNQLNLSQKIQLVGMAKGPSRKAGYEVLFLTSDKVRSVLAPDHPALHLLQHIRDEAHRFAITSHRQRRDKRRKTSILESVAGIGAKRRQQLLIRFGGLQGLQKASLRELKEVPGINEELAFQLYTTLQQSTG